MFTLEIMYVYILCIHTRVYSACIYAFKFMFLNQHVNPLQCEHVYGSDERIWNPLVMRLRSACFVVSDVCVWFGIYHQFLFERNSIRDRWIGAIWIVRTSCNHQNLAEKRSRTNPYPSQYCIFNPFDRCDLCWPTNGWPLGRTYSTRFNIWYRPPKGCFASWIVQLLFL